MSAKAVMRIMQERIIRIMQGRSIRIAADRPLGATRVSRLRASFACVNGRTVVASKAHTAPLKIAKTFPLGGPVAVIVMDVSPGLLAGDRYELQWTAGEGAHLYVTNQSYTKVHPAPDPSHGSSMRQTFELAPGAVIESMPEPTMLYRDALYRSDTEVLLSPGAVWIQAEVLCPGRMPRGERFAYRAYRSDLKVSYAGKLIYAQNQRIEPALQRLDSPGCFGEMTHTGVLYAFSDRIGAVHVEAVREALGAASGHEGYRTIAGVSATYRHGLAVMAAGTAAWPLQETLAAAWRALRATLLGLPPLDFRK